MANYKTPEYQVHHGSGDRTSGHSFSGYRDHQDSPGFPIPSSLQETHPQGQIFEFSFIPPPIHSTIINSTLVRRSRMVTVSNQEHLPGECSILKHVLECNGYPPRHIKNNLPPRCNPSKTSPNQEMSFLFWGPHPTGPIMPS